MTKFVGPQQFYARVWVRDGEVIAVTANTHPIVRNVVSPSCDATYDLIIGGAFMVSRDLREHLTFSERVESSGPEIIVQGPAGSLWQQA